jgi:hypothetical protein
MYMGHGVLLLILTARRTARSARRMQLIIGQPDADCIARMPLSTTGFRPRRRVPGGRFSARLRAMRAHSLKRAAWLWALGLGALPALAEPPAAEPLVLSTGSGTEIVSQRYPAAGDRLLLWFTGQFGRVEEEHRAAARLAERGVETWVTDFFAPYFLPLLPSSAGQVPDADLADWLEAVRRRHPDRRLILAAPGHLAAQALRAEQAWRARYAAGPAANPIAGALLLFPLLYQDLEPGQEPQYDPVVQGARLDVVILQPRSSAGFWWRDRLREHFEAAGGRVWLNVLAGLRDGFYRRADASAEETEAGARLGDIVLDGLAPLLRRAGADGPPGR